MENTRYAIWVELEGEAPEIAFHWRGDKRDGVRKAWADAQGRGLYIISAWAEEA